jgi:hypothetical protein
VPVRIRFVRTRQGFRAIRISERSHQRWDSGVHAEFTTRLSGGKGGRNALEAELRRLHVVQKNSRPNHPPADWSTTFQLSDLEPLRQVLEATVKRITAGLLGENVVPKDWGGEQCDLWTSELLVDGRAHTAAFVLKGPAVWRPMTIALLGKNGDQLNRLADTAAEVLVVQHCNVIRPEVFSFVQRLASDFRNPRRYMIIDGFATLRLLRLYGSLD